MSLRATSPWFWNTSRDGDPTTPLGSLCQSLTILSEKNFFLNIQPELPWHNLRPLSLVLLLCAWVLGSQHMGSFSNNSHWLVWAQLWQIIHNIWHPPCFLSLQGCWEEKEAEWSLCVLQIPHYQNNPTLKRYLDVLQRAKWSAWNSLKIFLALDICRSFLHHAQIIPFLTNTWMLMHLYRLGCC